MLNTSNSTGWSSRARGFALACALLAVLSFSAREVEAQGRDSLLNGAAIGAVVGAGVGVAFTHAVRDSDLVFSQYARGALIFGALGAGIGLGIDALLNRTSPAPGYTPPRLWVAPAVSRNVAGIVVCWQW